MLSDALGTDCMIIGDADPDESANLPSLYRGDGHRNEDYFGWGEPVLAPFDGVVDSVAVNGVTNAPGHLVREPATLIIFCRRDSTYVGYGHLRGLTVSQGDTVLAGQQMGFVGNNGSSWAPHIHVGAWEDRTPLQIRFDQWEIEGL